MRFDMGIGLNNKAGQDIENLVFVPPLNSEESWNRSRREKARKNLPQLCRATLSMINTKGCRRMLALKYFGEVLTELPARELPCWNICIGEEYPPELRCLLPNIILSKPETETSTKKKPNRAAKVSSEKKFRLRSSLLALRSQLWKEGGGAKRFHSYPASYILNYREIDVSITR